ncbi:hypothetical protein EDD21DRAFT_422081 [Dissophora ornata]|nr:hypothetical protein EDD21DRAFT_422081 [Dissophora ornata]
MILILTNVHTTTNTSTNLRYYLMAFPQYMDKLHEEQQRVLDAIQQERKKATPRAPPKGNVNAVERGL